MSRQLPLDLGFRPALAREDFFVGLGNRDAVAWIDRWPDWPGNAIALFGPPGCGKSHLVQVFARTAGARVHAATELRMPLPDTLTAPASAVAVEDCDAIPDERALLHLFNLMREHQRGLLLTAAAPPAQWRIALPDLSSRLKAITAVGIVPPDDDMFAAVLIKLFADRQLQVSPDVVTYLMRRVDRSFDAARRIVAELDRGALAAGRAVTVPLVKTLLDAQSAFDFSPTPEA